MNSASLIIAHGSREEESNQIFLSLIEKLREAEPGKIIVGAFLELAAPSILQGIEMCVQAGAQKIRIIPLMFFPGRHVKKDIPRIIEEARLNYPQVTFQEEGALSDYPHLLACLEERIRS